MVISPPAPLYVAETIEYGYAEARDIAAAARIYVEDFPERVEKLFGSKEQGSQFFLDLLDLMRLASRQTFFVARSNQHLVGYLVMTVPGAPTFRALFRERLVLRMLSNFLTGRYGYAPTFLGRMLASSFAVPNYKPERVLISSPHVYVIAVRSDYAGHGIGTALLEQAFALCRERFSHLSLYVDTINATAIRLYERHGFEIVGSTASQYVMVKNFAA